jgi:hypothetical protein
VSGEYNNTHTQLSGLVLTPAAALWWRF